MDLATNPKDSRGGRENLEFITNAKRQGSHVHVVTQLVNSMLGLVIFPWEATVLNYARTKGLDVLRQEGWPEFRILKGKDDCKTLYDLIHRLRNAVAHHRVRFSSDSGNPHEVEVTFEDRLKNSQEPHWIGVLSADDLERFCLLFTGFVEEVIA